MTDVSLLKVRHLCGLAEAWAPSGRSGECAALNSAHIGSEVAASNAPVGGTCSLLSKLCGAAAPPPASSTEYLADAAECLFASQAPTKRPLEPSDAAPASTPKGMRSAKPVRLARYLG